ncbi:NADH:flavin oxidoreductase/NADH oxidase [Luteitalea pratensis]|nr:NADH:flavin oxidoreductase/NADH oxidase [Luteitalea pratensis]
MPHLFSPLTIRGATIPNRVFVSPMCQYSSHDGFATDWHFVHLGTFAVGGAGLVIAEATAVQPNGRISPQDLGIWQDGHVDALARIAQFVHGQGSVAGIQLAHAGRKASCHRPWEGQGILPQDQGGWLDVVAPSAIPFSDTYPQPHALTSGGIAAIVAAFADAAARAWDAGFRVLEVHGAHGYLLHEFLSPISNLREDKYGGSFENRCRMTLEVVRAIRTRWPERAPLFVRLSATDWVEGGWDIEECVDLARRLAAEGVDLVDCSSGGNASHQRIPAAPGYQVPFASRIRRDAGVLTGAVGMITEANQADRIIAAEDADAVLLAREMLRDPRWAQHAAQALGHEVPWPAQYLRAAPARVPTRRSWTMDA